MTTSDVRASSLNCRLPWSLRRSRQALRLPRFQTRYPVCWAKGSPRGDPIRMTSAPLSARNMVVIGPAMPHDRSRTRTSPNAPAIRLHPFRFSSVDSTIALTMVSRAATSRSPAPSSRSSPYDRHSLGPQRVRPRPAGRERALEQRLLHLLVMARGKVSTSATCSCSPQRMLSIEVQLHAARAGRPRCAGSGDLYVLGRTALPLQRSCGSGTRSGGRADLPQVLRLSVYSDMNRGGVTTTSTT